MSPASPLADLLMSEPQAGIGALDDRARDIFRRIVETYLQTGEPVASAAGQVDVDSPDDPEFKALIAAMSSAIMSPPSWFTDIL